MPKGLSSGFSTTSTFLFVTRWFLRNRLPIDRLARYKHPKDIVVVEALPRNASGKVVKGELREKVRAVDAVS